MTVPLCAEGTLCIPNSQEIVPNPKDLIKWIDEKEITLIHIVPSLFRIMSRQIGIADRLNNLKYILLAVELLRGSDIERFVKIFASRIQLANLYGPTETTLIKLFHRISEEDCNKSIVPVGKSIYFTEVFILNDDLQPCLKGVVGTYIYVLHL